VVDELGYLPMDRRGAHALFQVVDRRNQAGNSICLTTNRSFASWGEIFEDDAVAAAILDRLLGNAVVINIRGESYRMRTHRRLLEETRKGGDHQDLTTLSGPPQAGSFRWQPLETFAGS
jgi:DNA replication protein DnaC